MISDSLIIIPSKQVGTEICDYLDQTIAVLSKQNMIFVVSVSEAISVREAIFSFFRIKNFHLFFTKKNKNLIYIRPLFLIPFRRHYKIEAANLKITFWLLKWWVKLHFPVEKRKLTWLFYPYLSSTTAYLGSNFETLVDLIDLVIPLDKASIEGIKKADYVFAISHSLRTLYLPLRKDITVVPQGFKLIETKSKLDKNSLIFPQKKPIIGFIGHLNERLDFKLLLKLIERNPQYLFVFAGPIHHEVKITAHKQPSFSVFLQTIQTAQNVQLVGTIPKKQLFQLINQFSICIIPYDVSIQFNFYSYPMKLFEYLYVGKPVISTPIKELAKFSKIIKIGKTVSDWEGHIKTSLQQKLSAARMNEFKKLAQENSWESKIEAISRTLNYE